MEYIFSYLSFSYIHKNLSTLPQFLMLMPITIFEFENPIIFLPSVYTEHNLNVNIMYLLLLIHECCLIILGLGLLKSWIT